MDHTLDRRSALRRIAVAAGTAGAAGLLAATTHAQETAQRPSRPAKLKGRLKQSVCRWCYGRMPLDELCEQAKAMGILSVEILSENEWATVAKHGLTCAMANGPGPIHEGWNRTAHHDRLVKESERLLPLVAAAGLPNMIVFSGNRGGLADAAGIANCVAGLQRITPLAEKLSVTVCLELLNSKVDHHDYQCDHTAWGVEVIKGVNSPRLKLLYDIYHMQIMEGDVIRTIRDNIAHIGHFHTGGVPGRNEIDDTQELNYKAVAQAIVDAGFKGYFAHEFVPKHDAMASLRAAVELCDV